MRSILLFSIIGLIWHASIAQTITGGEYFFDNDPGFGSGFVLTITPGSSIDENFNIDISGLSLGFHTLYIRLQDDDGEWGLVQDRHFYNTNSITNSQIIAAEVFFDSDPGFGNGNSLFITGGASIDEDLNVNISALSDGFHIMYLRVKDDDGYWSLVQKRPIYKSGTSNIRMISKAEVFYDSDPGFGNGIDIGIVADGTIDQSFAVDISPLSDGFHIMYLRVQDDDGYWSLVQKRPVYKTGSAEIRMITKAEVFYDDDPGFGNGIEVLFSANDTIDENIVLEIDTLSDGFHLMYLRVQDDDGFWSLVQKRPVYKSGNGPSPKIVLYETFVDNDPGFGNGIPYSNFTPAVLQESIFDVDLDSATNTLGDHILYIRALDDLGNWSLVADKPFERTTFSCPSNDVTLFLDTLGITTIGMSQLELPDWGTPDSTYITQTEFNCNDIGVSPLMDSLIGLTGIYTTTCSFQVSIVDTIPPKATCIPDTVYLDQGGSVLVLGSDLLSVVEDNCSVDSISSRTFFCSELGVNNWSIIIKDESENTTACNTVITVLDTIKPITDCSNLTVYLDSTGTYTLSLQDSSTIVGTPIDNCTIDSIHISQVTFDCTDIAFKNVDISIWDQSGNTSICQSIITVVDTISPISICQDITTHLDNTGNANIDVSQVDNTSSDACGIDTQYIDINQFDCGDLNLEVNNPNIITLTTIDIYNNSSTCKSEVTVLDTINPIVLCKDPVIYLDATGSASLDVAKVNNGSIDACGIDTMYLDDAQFDCQELVGTNIILTAIDSSGNEATCVSLVTVLDTIAPMMSCQDITVYLNDSSNYELLGNDKMALLGNTIDNCFIDSIFFSDTLFTCANIPSVITSIKVWDQSGNYNLCTPTITVIDTLGPILQCRDLEIELLKNKLVTIAPNDAIISVTDCLLDTYSLSKDAFDCSDEGSTTEVQLAATDGYGNESYCFVQVTVIDPHGYCCPDSLFVSGMPIDSLDYFASDSIVASGLIANQQNVNFRSTIIKMDSLTVDQGVQMQVINEDCNQN